MPHTADQTGKPAAKAVRQDRKVDKSSPQGTVRGPGAVDAAPAITGSPDLAAKPLEDAAVGNEAGVGAAPLAGAIKCQWCGKAIGMNGPLDPGADLPKEVAELARWIRAHKRDPLIKFKHDAEDNDKYEVAALLVERLAKSLADEQAQALNHVFAEIVVVPMTHGNMLQIGGMAIAVFPATVPSTKIHQLLDGAKINIAARQRSTKETQT